MGRRRKKECRMIRLSWNQFHLDCEKLAGLIRQSGKQYDKMVCITRGGVFVGGLLAHFLEMRHITTIALKLYEFNKQQAVVEELSAPDLPLPGSRILIVDDMLDSGRTMAFLMDKWADQYEIDIAVLYDKGNGDIRPTFCAATIPDEWVWFPWEPKGK